MTSSTSPIFPVHTPLIPSHQGSWHELLPLPKSSYPPLNITLPSFNFSSALRPHHNSSLKRNFTWLLVIEQQFPLSYLLCYFSHSTKWQRQLYKCVNIWLIFACMFSVTKYKLDAQKTRLVLFCSLRFNPCCLLDMMRLLYK